MELHTLSLCGIVVPIPGEALSQGNHLCHTIASRSQIKVKGDTSFQSGCQLVEMGLGFDNNAKHNHSVSHTPSRTYLELPESPMEVAG